MMLFYPLIISQLTGYLLGIISFILKLFVAEIQLKSDAPYYEFLYDYIKMSGYKRFGGYILMRTGEVKNINNFYYRSDENIANSEKNIRYNLGSGFHIFYRGWKDIICIYKSSDTNSSILTTHVYIPFGNEGSACIFEKQIEETYKNMDNIIENNIMTINSSRFENSWIKSFIEKTDINNIILDENIKTNLIKDIKKFFSIETKKFYKKISKQYHRGYLFHGLPGTGKTSLIIALASYFNTKIYTLNINNLYDISSIQRSLGNIPSESIILLEDIDRYNIFDKENKEKKENKDNENNKTEKNDYVAYNNMLQILDGLITPSGCIFIMTCNNISKIDDVFLRPGRTDYKLEFTYASKDQTRKFFIMFYEDNELFNIEDINALADKFAEEISNTITTSQIQNHLFTYQNDPLLAIQNKIKSEK